MTHQPQLAFRLLGLTGSLQARSFNRSVRGFVLRFPALPARQSVRSNSSGRTTRAPFGSPDWQLEAPLLRRA